MFSSLCFMAWSEYLTLLAILIKILQYELAFMDYWVIIVLTNLYICNDRVFYATLAFLV